MASAATSVRPPPGVDLRATASGVAGGLGWLRSLPKLIRNPIESWPEDVYRLPVVRTRVFGRDHVFVTDPELIHTLLVDQAACLGRHEIMLRSLGPALGQGILTADGEPWRRQRQAASPSFRPDRIDSFVPEFVSAAEAARARWSALPDGAEIDLPAEMMRLTLQIIMRTMLADDALDPDRFGAAIADYLAPASWQMAMTLLRLPRWAPHPGSRAARRACETLRTTVAAVLERQRSLAAPRNDLLGHLLGATVAPGVPMSDEQLVDNMLTFIAAGHETTALALSWTFHCLAGQPATVARMLAEIDAATAASGLTAGTLDGLAFTHQVVREVLRLYPPAPLMVREVRTGLTLGGERLDAGTSVQIPIYAIHRHRSLWPDPERFDPARFSPERAGQRHRYSYLPFGAGPRICIGMRFAISEIVAILAVLLPAFALSTDGRRPEPQFRVTLKPRGGMPMTLRHRVIA